MDYKVEMWIGELESGLNEDDLDYLLARHLKHSELTTSVVRVVAELPSHDKEL